MNVMEKNTLCQCNDQSRGSYSLLIFSDLCFVLSSSSISSWPLSLDFGRNRNPAKMLSEPNAPSDRNVFLNSKFLIRKPTT